MFNCDQCHTPTGPRIKPVVQAIAVAKEYLVRRVDEAPLVTVGSEIVRELRLCATCAGVEVALQKEPDFKSARLFASGAKGHVQGCNKHLDDCRSCKGIVAYFSAFPLIALSAALEDVQAKAVRPSLASLAVDNLLEQNQRNTKRSQRDFSAGYLVLKAYEQRGGSL